jgi:hypothetical protein
VNRWQRLRATSWPERRVLAQALILLPVAHLALRLARLEALLTRLARQVPPPDAVDTQAARSAARMVNVAARYGPYRAPCLERSLVLWWLLRRRGIATDLRIGVRKADGEFEAHAWVELEGAVINDRADIATVFAPLPAGDREAGP